MATLEHRTDGGRNEYRLRFQLNNRRLSLALTGLDEAGAMEAKEHIEHLIAQARRNRPPSSVTAKWLDDLDTALHDRLAALDLVDAREVAEQPRRVLAFMTAYIKSRTDWKKPANHTQAVNHLKNYLRRDVPFGVLTHGDAEAWHLWMQHAENGPKLSPNTAGQHVKRCRQIMRAAVKFGLTKDNPFDGVKICLQSDESKNYDVSHFETRSILDACPDQEWRTLFALNRYGGLRLPSEVLRLRWCDIAWDAGRFKVHSPKTERYGKAERIVPLFPELMAELEAQRELCESKAGSKLGQYVIQRYRDSEANLRTTFHKICDRAGVQRFPKPFMNCRATRRNELGKQGFRAAALNAWFGHSQRVAEKNYDRAGEDEYQAALQIMGADLGVGIEARQEPPENRDDGKPRVLRTVGIPWASAGSQEYTPEDSNL